MKPVKLICMQCRARRASGILYRSGKRQPRCQQCIDARLLAERERGAK